MRRPMAVGGAACLLLLALLAIFADTFTHFDPTLMDLSVALQSVSREHFLGTDQLGRDVVARLLYGGRISLMIGLAATVVALVVGLTLGLVAGYFGGRIELPILAVCDLLLAFPTLLFALFLVATVGASTPTLVFAIGAREVPVYVRLVRSGVLSLKETDFVLGATAVGAGHIRIITQHILPNTLGIVIVQSTFMVSRAIITVASLGFLGLGVPAPTPEWGVMLAEARPYLPLAPHLMLAPGFVLAVVVLSLNAVGDSLRDFLDPRMSNVQAAAKPG